MRTRFYCTSGGDVGQDYVSAKHVYELSGGKVSIVFQCEEITGVQCEQSAAYLAPDDAIKFANAIIAIAEQVKQS